MLNNATQETDNPDLRDRAYVYWRLLSTDPEVRELQSCSVLFYRTCVDETLVWIFVLVAVRLD